MSRGAKDPAESIRQRLRNAVRARGDDVQFALVRYAAERFLARLSASRQRETLALKGAMLLTVWGDLVYRPTRDIDFTGYGKTDPDSLLVAVREICATPVADDGLVFDATGQRPVRKPGVEARLRPLERNEGQREPPLLEEVEHSEQDARHVVGLLAGLLDAGERGVPGGGQGVRHGRASFCSASGDEARAWWVG